jgi:hypothetical protein
LALLKQTAAFTAALTSAAGLRASMEEKYQQFLKEQKPIKVKIHQHKMHAELARDEGDQEGVITNLAIVKAETTRLTKLLNGFRAELSGAVALARDHAPELLNSTWWASESKATGKPVPVWGNNMCSFFGTNGLQRMDLSFESFQEPQLVSNASSRHRIFKAWLQSAEQPCALKQFASGSFQQVCMC